MSVSTPRATLLALALLAGPGTAPAEIPPSGEAALAKILGDRVQGDPVNCLFLSELHSSQIVAGTAIVYEGNRKTLYVNRPNGASLLRQGDIIVSHPHGSQICKLDLLDLVDQGSHMTRGSVSMGIFVPYRKAPKTP